MLLTLQAGWVTLFHHLLLLLLRYLHHPLPCLLRLLLPRWPPGRGAGLG